MTLALFDLDNTLLGGDSDHGWGVFLGEIGALDAQQQTEKQDYFYQQYRNGQLDIDEFLRFQLKPLAEHPKELLLQWRDQYLQQVISSFIRNGKPELLEPHRQRGDELVIITATNDFITQPIADRLQVPTLLATRAEIKNGHYTGSYSGTPCFREGKITVLNEWLASNGRSLATLEHSVFYSDSANDLPLLLAVDEPIAVRPDNELRSFATQKNWNIID